MHEITAGIALALLGKAMRSRPLALASPPQRLQGEIGTFRGRGCRQTAREGVDRHHAKLPLSGLRSDCRTRGLGNHPFSIGQARDLRRGNISYRVLSLLRGAVLGSERSKTDADGKDAEIAIPRGSSPETRPAHAGRRATDPAHACPSGRAD